MPALVDARMLARLAALPGAHSLRALDGNVSLAAQQLGIGRATLYRRLAQYGLLVQPKS